MAQKKKNKTSGGIIYSTDPDFNYSEPEETLEPITKAEQTLIVSLDKKGRKGKQVTLITGFYGSDEELKALCKLLKNKCGVGGSTKDNQILIQGDLRSSITNILLNEGYKKTKKK
ncbi:MAG TPA: translation initiation factor [Cyclobacteriaceae bacterium]